MNSAVLPTCVENTCTQCGVCSYSICGALVGDELVELDRMAKRAVFGPKEALFSQSEPSTRIFNISEGVVRIYKLLPDGRRQVIGFKLPGDFLGLTAADTHNLSADAIGHVAVCWFQKAAFMRFVDHKLPLLRRMNEFATRELGLAQERMLLLGRYSAEEKMASFIVNWRDRLARVDRSKDLVLPMSRRDIADYLGLTIQTVSRTFTKLERDGVIAVVPGGVKLRNEKRAQLLALAMPPDC